MKTKIFLVTSFILLCGSAFSQIYTPQKATVYGQHNLRTKSDSVQHIPEKDSTTRNTSDTSAQIFLNKKDSAVWVWTLAKGYFKIGGGSLDKAGWGQTKRNDTIFAGGRGDGVIGYYIRNNFTVGAPSGYVRYSNRLTMDSVVDGPSKSSLNDTLGRTDAQYNGVMMSLAREFREEWNDTANLQYGGTIGIVDRRVYDSGSTRFGAYPAKKPIILGDKGVEVTNQFFPPRDTTDVYSDIDGRSGASFSSLFGLGGSWGYNIHVFSAYPDYPLASYNAVVDLQRRASRTRHRSITGAGVTGYITSWKHWQANMDTATASLGNYISKTTGYTAYGSTDISLGGLGATKAQILLRTKVDSSIAFLALPQWRSLNEVDNGYGFLATGDSDYNYMPRLRIGGSIPTKANGGSSDKGLEVISQSRFTGIMYFKSAANITSTETPDLSTPGSIIFKTKDSTYYMSFGNPYNEGAGINMYGRYVNTATRGGIDVNIDYANTSDYGANPNSPFRITFVNGVTTESRYRLQRNKFYAEVTDSFSFQAPSYKFAGMPTGQKAYILMQDADGYTYKYDTTGLWASGGGGGTNIYNSNGTVTSNRTVDGGGLYLKYDNGLFGIGVTPSYKFHTESSVSSDFVAWIKNTHSSGKGLRVSANSTSSELLGVYGGSSGVTEVFKVNGNGFISAANLPSSSSNDMLVGLINSSGNFVKVTLGTNLSYSGSTLNAASGVTSVASGYGTNFSTITTTGTVVADSTILLDKRAQNIISGAMKYTTAPTPAASGATNLGTSSIPWGNLYLKSLGVIDFGSNYTMTHTSGTLTTNGTFIANNLFMPGNGLFGTHTTGDAADMYVIGNSASSSTTADIQLLGSSNVSFRVLENGSTNYSIPVGYLYAGHIIGGQKVTEPGSGNLVGIGSLTIRPPQVTSGASTVSDTWTLALSGQPTATVSGYNAALWIISGNLRMGKAGTNSGSFSIEGSTSGKIDFLVQAAAGTYNWNYPITSGSSSDMLTSGGGSGAAMTWTPRSTFIINANVYRGISTQNGGGSIITIPHPFGTAPASVVVKAGSIDAAGDCYVTTDASNIYVNYLVSTPSGTSNIVLNYIIFKD